MSAQLWTSMVFSSSDLCKIDLLYADTVAQGVVPGQLTGRQLPSILQGKEILLQIS